MKNLQRDRWYPVASTADLPARHVYHTALQGQELAIWRDDNGVVNAWENRCPHRGMRLSMGVNNGNELRCQYHGWTYESGSGACTFVPAHRTATRPTSACANSYAVKELEGIVWASLGVPSGNPLSLCDAAGSRSILRSLPFNTDLLTLARALQEHRSRFSEVLQGQSVELRPLDSKVLQLSAADGTKSILFYLQPHSPNKSIAHAVLLAPLPAIEKEYESFSTVVSEFRRSVEQGSPKSVLHVKSIERAAGEVATAADPGARAPSKGNQTPEIFCKVISRVQQTDDIISIELAPVDRAVPQLAPGMHVSVRTPAGLVRQYSVVNRPDERDAIVIGIKREPDSRGGSQSMHDSAKEGTELAITIPRNGFPLRRNARSPLLIAGGIGITPILAMAQALHASAASFEMHYFVRGPEHTPFKDRLKTLAPFVHIHGGLDAAQTKQKLGEIFERADPTKTEVYTCGPGPMIDTVTQVARARGFDEEHIRFEYFKNEDAVLTGSGFDVTLLKSGKSFRVAPETTLLNACLENGVEIEASCEQGVCGTCMTTVISGVPEHNDTYLSKQERESGKWIMPCVSRCKSGPLVLDI